MTYPLISTVETVIAAALAQYRHRAQSRETAQITASTRSNAANMTGMTCLPIPYSAMVFSRASTVSKSSPTSSTIASPL